MNMKGSDRYSFRFHDRRQKRIYERLVLVGEGPAAFYRDACRIIATEPPFETTTHLVGHCLREIESALRDVLKPAVGNTTLSNGSKKNMSGEEEYKHDITIILQGLDISETDAIAQLWLRLPGRKSPYALHRYAHRDNLTRPRPFDQDFRMFWQEMETVFDSILERFEARYLSSHRLIDTLLAKDMPTETDMGVLKKQVPHNRVALGYFFEELSKRKNKDWLKPLRTEGFFKYPPNPEPDPEKGVVSLPIWPASRYLSQMAALDSETVMSIALDIPDTARAGDIENVHVYEDLLDAALAMPAHVAMQLLPKVQRWMKLPYQGVLPEKWGVFIAHLAEGGQIDSALELTRSLFAHVPDMQASFDIWHYHQTIKVHLPHLVAIAGIRMLDLLCDLLALEIQPSDEEDTSLEASSFLWRPAIEEHNQNVPEEFEKARDVLVSLVRDTAEQLVREQQVSVQEAVSQFERRAGSIFHRLTLYLLSIFPQNATELVAKYLTDRQEFDNTDSRHEYTLLAQAGFTYLSSMNQAAILGWIEQGPTDVEAVKTFYEQQTGKRPTDEIVIGYRNSWQRDWLARLGSELPPEWRARYELLVAEIGPAMHPEFETYVSEAVWEQHESPKSVEELQVISVKEIVTFLKSWQPISSEDVMHAFQTPRGLANMLMRAIELAPGRFAEQARLFRRLNPIYVAAVLTSFERAANQHKFFPWPSILDLCHWVVTQRRKPSKRKDRRPHYDPQWVACSKTIMSLLSIGFNETPIEIPFDLRPQVWEVVQTLTEDPNPTLEDERHFGSSAKELARLALNTVRGLAMHAVIKYALWVRRHVVQEHEKDAYTIEGFDTLPEVREVLNQHLTLGYDSSLAVRSIYGQRFPWFVFLDQRWATQNISSIFPAEETFRDWWNAAWETYVIYCRLPRANIFHLLSQEYQRAVERIGSSSHMEQHPYNPEEHLAEHLMTLYWRGELDLYEPEGILAQFFSQAPDMLRSYAVEFIGRSLYTMQEAIPLEVLTRLQKLWEWYTEFVSRTGLQDERITELATFGWWFSSGKFDDIWAITQLEKVLKGQEKIDMQHAVVKRLAQLSVKLPLPTVKSLYLLVLGDKDIWITGDWKELVRIVIANALCSSDREASRSAKHLVNLFESRGISDFRSIIQSVSEGQ